MYDTNQQYKPFAADINPGYGQNPYHGGGKAQQGFYAPPGTWQNDFLMIGNAAQAQMDAADAKFAEDVRREVATIDANQFCIAKKLLETELQRIEMRGEPEYMDLDLMRNIRLVKKVNIPTNRYPGFNFIGKLLGPGGKTLQNLAKGFKCHVFILGRGSTRHPEKEQADLESGDPKFAHYALPLHVRVETEAPPHIAYTRVAGVIEQLHAYLQPVRDDIVNNQLADLAASKAAQSGEEGTEGVKEEGDGGEEGAVPTAAPTATPAASTPSTRGRGRGGRQDGGFVPRGHRGGRGGMRGRGRGTATMAAGAGAMGGFTRYPTPTATDYGAGAASYDYTDYGGGNGYPVKMARGTARGVTRGATFGRPSPY